MGKRWPALLFQSLLKKGLFWKSDFSKEGKHYFYVCREDKGSEEFMSAPAKLYVSPMNDQHNEALMFQIQSA